MRARLCPHVHIRDSEIQSFSVTSHPFVNETAGNYDILQPFSSVIDRFEASELEPINRDAHQPQGSRWRTPQHPPWQVSKLSYATPKIKDTMQTFPLDKHRPHRNIVVILSYICRDIIPETLTRPSSLKLYIFIYC